MGYFAEILIKHWVWLHTQRMVDYWKKENIAILAETIVWSLIIKRKRVVFICTLHTHIIFCQELMTIKCLCWLVQKMHREKWGAYSIVQVFEYVQSTGILTQQRKYFSQFNTLFHRDCLLSLFLSLSLSPHLPVLCGNVVHILKNMRHSEFNVDNCSGKEEASKRHALHYSP